MTLDAITHQYEEAEITLILADLITQNRCVLVYGVAELRPSGQPRSPAITSGIFPQYRKSIGGEITLYAKRLFVTPEEALTFFRNPEKEPSGLRELLIEIEGRHFTFPPEEEPLLLEPNSFDKTGLGAVLPRRPTCLRLVSKFDTQGATLALFNSTQRDSMFQICSEILGINLARFSEHVGALHFCFSNPIVSRFDARLSDDEQHLLLSVSERPGKTIRGCLVELGNEWLPFGQGFSILHELNSRYSVIPLPANPSALRLRLFDSSRRCIENHPAATFIRGFSIATSHVVNTDVVRVLADGSSQTIVMETAQALNPVGEAEQRPPSPVEYLKAGNVTRELEDLRQSKTFMFFSGKGTSRAEAIDALRELIDRATKRVTVVDAYLSVDDLFLILPFIRQGGCKVKLLASNDQITKANADKTTKEFRLSSELIRLSSDLPCSIEARKMPGAGAHDRWLQVDDQIYALGSSINHFGDRATMLFKLPRPEEISAAIEGWWDKSVELNPTLAHPDLTSLIKRFFEQLKKSCGTLRQIPAAWWRHIRSGGEA